MTMNHDEGHEKNRAHKPKLGPVSLFQNSAIRTINVRDLGTMAYDDALSVQQAHHNALKDGTGQETLLLVEHPPVITMGRGAKAENIIATESRLEKMGISVMETGRGGDVTYHGPGQLVAYPIMNLNTDRRDVRKYVKCLERTMIDTCAHFGVEADLFPPNIGVWVEKTGPNPRKIGAIGVRISRWITLHGLALNVTTELDAFDLIVPCGLRDLGVTSLRKELTAAPSMSDVKTKLVESFCSAYGAQTLA